MSTPNITAAWRRCDGCATFIVRGRYYSFLADYVPEADREWFLNTMARILNDVDKRAESETRQVITNQHRELIGLPPL